MKNITINDKVNRAIKKYGYEPNELAAEYLVGLFESE